ncbi:MAG: ComEC/Rec2 family competence protein [Pseudomonadota bacterium]
MKTKYIILSVLVSSFIYASYFGDSTATVNKVVCKSDVFDKEGVQSKYSYLYSIMFLGCRLKSDQQSRTYLDHFYNTGTGHLLSISGLHIGSLALFIFVVVNVLLFLISRGSKNIHVPFFYFSVPVSIAASILYVYLIGVEIPRLRALVMLVMAASSMYLPLFRNRMFILGLAAAIVLFSMPESVYSYSFYYSFIAVFAIFISPSKRTLIICLSIYAFLLPLNLHSQGVIDVSNIISNAVVIPFFSFLYFPLELIGLVLFFSGVHSVLYLMDGLTDVLIFMLKHLSFVSEFVKVRTFNITLFELLILYALLGVLFLGFRSYKRINRAKALYIYICVVAASLVLPLYFYYEYKDPGLINFAIDKPVNFNGSGDIVLIDTGNKTVVIDTGYGWKDTFRAIREIKRRKIDTIDYLIITHADIDHSGGLTNFLDDKTLKIKKILIPAGQYIEGVKNAVRVCAGTKIKLNGQSSIKFINPVCETDHSTRGAHYSARDNINRSALAFILKLNGYNFLFSSDVPWDVIKKDISGIAVPKDLVYQLSHHCSRKDNLESFASNLAPLLGFCTRDSHLMKSAVDKGFARYPIIMTGRCGDIQMDVSGEWLSVSSPHCKKIKLRTTK